MIKRAPGRKRLPQLVVMARWPAPGRCKRRLAKGLGNASGLGNARAAMVQQALTRHTMATAIATARQGQIGQNQARFEVVLAVSGLAPRAARRWAQVLGADRWVLQGQGDLGLRMQRQVLRGLGEGARQLVLIGSDLPGLEASDLEQAFRALDQTNEHGQSSLVLGPASDGGYWLVGLNRSWPSLFAGIPWGGERVLAATKERAVALGITPHWLRERDDLDWPADLLPWR